MLEVKDNLANAYLVIWGRRPNNLCQR